MAVLVSLLSIVAERGNGVAFLIRINLVGVLSIVAERGNRVHISENIHNIFLRNNKKLDDTPLHKTSGKQTQ